MAEQKLRDKLYEFSKDGNSCFIQNPRTPRYWYNYLWNENRYCAQVSQIGHGRSYYLSEKADMCMVNQNDARYIYLRDEEDHSCWNIGEGPLNTEVEDYRCTHSIGYSLLESKYHAVKSSWRIFVPCEGFHEVWRNKKYRKYETVFKHFSGSEFLSGRIQISKIL